MKLPAKRTDGAKAPLISIIIVVRNGAATISAAIASVHRQSFKDLELIIVDGASTDRTLEIIRANSDAVDRWISEPDYGIYDGMNKGVTLARGDWVYFLGCDDVMLDCLRAVAPRLLDKQKIYYGDVVKTSNTGTRYDGRFNSWKLLKRNICHQAMFYPRVIFDRRQFNLLYPQLADWEFNLRCYGDPHLCFEYIPATIARYNDITGAASTITDWQFAKDHARIIRECLPIGCYAWHRIKLSMHALSRSMRA